MKVILTGCNGFIFSNFLKTVLKIRPDWNIVGIDNCDDAVNIKNIIPNTDKYKFYLADIRDAKIIDNIFNIERPDIIIHGAARSFVDSSIEDPMPFITTNVVGTQNLINASIKYNISNFFYISTDEVYGSLMENEASWTEDTTTKPSSPYSASKLSGEHIVIAANKTYGLNYNITRCCNILGENQQTRNLIPKCITSLISSSPIILHDCGKPIREWLYVQDKISAILTILEKGKINEIYNIGSGVEKKNIDMYLTISNIMERSVDLRLDEIRKGQDFRYSVDCSKIRQLGWQPKYSFEDGLNKTINWYRNNLGYYD
jgi:dTDP-glucose 4,6-dehydratase